MLITVRSEQARDIAAIRELNRLAFGQELEGQIVDLLRSNGAVSMSLVAIAENQIVGHILYSPVQIGELAGVGLGPMAVQPSQQRQGIGSRLIAAGNRRLQKAGCPFIVVLGHAEYYPRFGFIPASTRGITCEWNVPDDVFMILVFDEVKMKDVTGLVKYRPEFSAVA